MVTEHLTANAKVATRAETHTKRVATQHGCLPSLVGDGVKRIEIVYGKENNILYWAA